MRIPVETDRFHKERSNLYVLTIEHCHIKLIAFRDGLSYNIDEVIDVQTQRETTVKYTAVLPRTCMDGLKTLAKRNAIPSVNQGIRLAVEDFVRKQEKLAYEQAMREAAGDPAFLKRTMDTQDAFANADAEGLRTW